MSVGGVVATILRIWGRNMPRFLVLTLVCYVPIVGWYALHRFEGFKAVLDRYVYEPLFRLHPMLQPQEVVGLGWAVFAIFGAAIAVSTVAQLRGGHTSIWRGLATALRHALPLVAIAFVVRLATHGIALAIRIARWEPGPPLYRGDDTIFSLVLFAVLWIAASCAFIAVLPAAVIERRGPFAAIARGFSILRGAWFRAGAVAILHFVFVFGLYRGLAHFMIPWLLDGGDTSTRFIIYSYIRLALEILLFALTYITAAVIYERAREAKEGPAPDQLVRVFD